jgi:hypothetical protein
MEFVCFCGKITVPRRVVSEEAGLLVDGFITNPSLEVQRLQASPL